MSGGTETQIDFILLRKDKEIHARDCKVIPGEACTDLKVSNLKRRGEQGGEKKLKE